MIMPENFNKNLEQKRGPWFPPPPPPPQKKKKKKKNWILCQNSRTRELKIRVVGFVLKKLLTYFEMLIVPHALQCVDGCFGPVFTASTSIWQRPYCEGILLSYGRILPRLRCSCCTYFSMDTEFVYLPMLRMETEFEYVPMLHTLRFHLNLVFA